MASTASLCASGTPVELKKELSVHFNLLSPASDSHRQRDDSCLSSASTSSSVQGIFTSIYAEQERRKQQQQPVERSPSPSPSPPPQEQEVCERKHKAAPVLNEEAGRTVNISDISYISTARSTNNTWIDSVESPITVKLQFRPLDTDSQLSSRQRSHSRSSSTSHVPGHNPERLRMQQLRKEALTAEVERERMSECTFTPVLSPMVDFHLQHASRSGRSYSASRVCTRLPEREVTEPHDFKKSERLAERREQDNLRRHCGGYCWEPIDRTDAFQLFLSNALHKDCRSTSFEALAAAGRACATVWRSDGECREGSTVIDSCTPIEATDTSRQSVVNKLSRSQERSSEGDFDRFLNRQSAHVRQKEGKLQTVVDSLTPQFHPQTTKRSEILRKKMIQRSLNNSGDRSFIVEAVAQHQSLHIPLSQPLKAAARAASPTNATAHKPEEAELAAHPFISPAHSSSARCDALYRDSLRRVRAQAAAEEASIEHEVRDFTFQPKLNDNRTVRSCLETSNYSRFEEHRHKKAAAQRKMREDMLKEREMKELAECTFRPQINKTPTYLSTIHEGRHPDTSPHPVSYTSLLRA